MSSSSTGTRVALTRAGLCTQLGKGACVPRAAVLRTDASLLLGSSVLPSSLPDSGSGRGVVRLGDQVVSSTRVPAVREGVRPP